MSHWQHFRVWRGDSEKGELVDYPVEVNEGEVVLDIIHRLQQTEAGDLAVRWNCKAGKCGSCSAEINGQPRLMCMTRMSTFEPDEVITVTPAHGDTVTAATTGGKVLVFAADELTELSGPGRGVILMRVDKKDRLIGALCHAADETPIAVAEDGTERRFHAPAHGKRAQSGRKALQRFKAVELVPRKWEE